MAMVRIESGQRAGKTKKQVDWVKADSNRILVVPDDSIKQNMIIYFGLTSEQVMTMQEYVYGKEAPHDD